jgi:hypothetical protein
MGVRALQVSSRQGGLLPRFLIITEQTETYLLFAVLMMVPWTFAFLPFLYGILCFITAGARVAAATASMEPTAKP